MSNGHEIERYSRDNLALYFEKKKYRKKNCVFLENILQHKIQSVYNK
jgi:hypothetical protein